MRTMKKWLAAMLIISMTLGDCGGITVSAAENTTAVETSVSENTTVSDGDPADDREPAGNTLVPEDESPQDESPKNEDNGILPETSVTDPDDEKTNPRQEEIPAPEATVETELPVLHMGQLKKEEKLPSPEDPEFVYDLPVSFEAADCMVLFVNYAIDGAFEKEGAGTLRWSILRGEKGMSAGSTSLTGGEDDWTGFETVPDSPYFTLTENEEEESGCLQTAELSAKETGNGNDEMYDYYIRAAYYPMREDGVDEAFYAAVTVPFLPAFFPKEDNEKNDTAVENGPDAEETQAGDTAPNGASVSENTSAAGEDIPDEEPDAEESAPEDLEEIPDNGPTEDESGAAPTPENTVSENSMAAQTMEIFSAPSDSESTADTQPLTADSVGVLTLDAESVTLRTGELAAVCATVVLPNEISSESSQNNAEIVWKSSNDSIVTVSGTAKTAVKDGYVSVGTIKALETEADVTAEVVEVTAECNGMKAAVKVKVVNRTEVEVTDLSGDIWVDGFQKEKKSLVYTGQKITQDFHVYYKDTLLKEKTDYTLSYKNNVNAAAWDSAKAPGVTIKLKGQYSGSVTLYYTIYPADINAADKDNPVKATASDPPSYESSYEQAVTKSKNLKIPNPVMTFHRKKLKVNKDFVCDYSTLPTDYKKGDSYTPGKVYYYTVKGIGNFEGSYQMKLVVVDNKGLNFSSASVKLDKKQYEYHGKALSKSDVTIETIKVNNQILDKNLYDYEVCAEGIEGAYLIVYPTSAGQSAGYHGCKRINLKLTGDRDIKETVSGQNWKESIVFSQTTVNKEGGIFQEKTGVLTFGGEALNEGDDYTVKYSNAKKAGSVTATFTGKGRYRGTLRKRYQITPNMDKSHFTIHWKNATKENGTLVIAYQKGGAVPDFVLKDQDGNILKMKTDYTIKCKDNKTPGAAMSCEITGKGNYKGYTEMVSLKVKNGDISRGTISVPDKPYSKKENAWKSKVTIKDVNGKTLSVGTDYEREFVYQYKNSENGQLPAAGTTVEITVQGKGCYEGSAITGNYRIFQNNISKLQIVIDNQEYTGKEITLSSEDIHVYATAADKKNKNELKNAQSCYEIAAYKNNIRAGTAKVTLHGIGDYGGTKTCSFKIQKRAYLINSVKGITLDRTTLSFYLQDKEEKRTLTATITPKDASMDISNPTVIWSSSNNNIATVKTGIVKKADPGDNTQNNMTVTGIITAKKAGSITITAATQDGNKRAQCKVTIEMPVFDQADQTIKGKTGDTYQLTFSGANMDGIAFESDNPKVVSVDEKGLLTMKKPGMAAIRVYVGSREYVQQCYVIVEGEVNPGDAGVLTYNRKEGVSDTKGINDLLRQAEHSDGAYDTVYIPAGVYQIDAVSDFGGIVLTDNQNLIMSPDARLEAIGNSSGNSQIIFAFGRKNVTISGGQIVGERNKHTGSGGEWGHGINIAGCTNVYIKDVEVSQCWGDGIYLGLYDSWDAQGNRIKIFGSGITIINCNLHDNRRNNLSITDVDHVTIDHCKFNYANGTDPQFGIDIEPNTQSHSCENIKISNSTFTGNAKASMGIMTAAKDIRIENCTMDGDFINWAGKNVVLKSTTIGGKVTDRTGGIKRE